MDLEKLDLEEVDKEMAADEVAQSSAVGLMPPRPAVLQLMLEPAIKRQTFPCYFFFLLGAHVLGLFVNLTSE